MPITPTYPGVYIEELPSGVRTITGVSTSVTGFIGRARRGDVNKAITVFSFPEYEREFGGLWEESAMGYAVYQYFLNGGSQAVIVRVFNDDGSGVAQLDIDSGNLLLDAVSPGEWGTGLLARVDHATKDELNTNLFNLTVKDPTTGLIEVHRNVSIDISDARYVGRVLDAESALVKVNAVVARPGITPAPDAGASDFEDNADEGALSNAVEVVAGTGTDGNILVAEDISGDGAMMPKTGLYAFDDADMINLLCVPPYTVLDGAGSALASFDSGAVLNGDVEEAVRTNALVYAKGRRAMLLVDPPSSWNAVSDVDADALNLKDENAVLYFPRLKVSDPLRDGQLETFVPCGAMAGLMARTDAQRGVWKAPAGIEANLTGVSDLSVQLTDQENGLLNPKAVNCLRTFKGVGRVAWGARTMRGADVLADQWKYLPVRRLALYLEESLYRGSQWIVFEPNDEPLWAQIRLNFGAFMHNLFRQGAFQGTTPKQAYLVKCDSETTTQNDINQGIVNIVVGFAPLKPAEFVIIKIQQLAGQVDA